MSSASLFAVFGLGGPELLLILAVVLLLTPYWVWRQPRPALVGLAAGLTALVVEEGFTAFERPSALAYLAAVAFSAAGLVHRLAAAG